MAARFPLAESAAVLVEVCTELDCPLTEHEIKHPTPAKVQQVYQTWMVKFLEINLDDCVRTAKQQLDQMDYHVRRRQMRPARFVCLMMAPSGQMGTCNAADNGRTYTHTRQTGNTSRCAVHWSILPHFVSQNWRGNSSDSSSKASVCGAFPPRATNVVLSNSARHSSSSNEQPLPAKKIARPECLRCCHLISLCDERVLKADVRAFLSSALSPSFSLTATAQRASSIFTRDPARPQLSTPTRGPHFRFYNTRLDSTDLRTLLLRPVGPDEFPRLRTRTEARDARTFDG